MIETVGIDVGGTKIAAGLLRDGKLVERERVATEAEDTDALVEQLVSAIEETRGSRTAAVGLGVPSVVDFATGRARSSVNVPLEDVPLRELLSDRLGLPVFVDNDATVAALAEAWEGERIAVDSLVMFTVGTGVGGGLVLGGRVWRGATGAAGELGHMLIGLDLSSEPVAADSFPQPGSLEAYASGSELDRLAAEAASRSPSSALGVRLAERGMVDGRDAVEAAHGGDEEAAGAIRRLGARLGIGIANAINALDPEVVAIGGGVSVAGELLLQPARETAMAYVLPGVGTRTEIRLARCGPEAGVLGAALLAVSESASS